MTRRTTTRTTTPQPRSVGDGNGRAGDVIMAPTVTLSAAQRAVAAALQEAEGLSVDVCIAASDRAGYLLVVFGGGVPLVSAGRTIGGIGVSGGSSEQDVRIAEAGAEVLL